MHDPCVNSLMIPVSTLIHYSVILYETCILVALELHNMLKNNNDKRDKVILWQMYLNP